MRTQMKEQPKEEDIEHILKEEEQIDRLDREIKQNKKKIKQIETSNTWKLSNTFQQMKRMIDNLFNRKQLVEQKNRIKVLEQKLTEAALDKQHLREERFTLDLQDKQFSRHTIEKQIRELKNEGELINLLDSLIDKKIQGQANFKEALTYAARLYMHKDKQSRNYIYKKILAALSVEEIPEFMIRAGLDEAAIPLQQVASYRASLHKRIRQLQLHARLPEWELDDKRRAYEFIKRLDVPVPFVDEATYSIHTLPIRAGTVIKPKDGAGGRGVYIIHELDDIIDVKNSTKLTNKDTLIDAIKRDLTSGAVETDEWMLEELIYEDKRDKIPARDVKFYCFYGKVGIILEIIRYPEVRHCWWTAEGERIPVDKYDESLFSGSGVTEEELEMVENLSQEIPAPSIRIDFLREEKGLVFGEFTPKPGNYDEFDSETDEQLGDLFIEAEARLTTDLLDGKSFYLYKEFVQNQEKINKA